MNRYILAIKSIYNKKYIVLNIALFFLFYFLITLPYYLVRYLLETANPMLIILLAITASISTTIAISSVIKTRLTKALTPSISTITVISSSLVASCGCSVSLLSGLAVLGLTATQILSLDTFLANFNNYILLIFILINIALIFYNINKALPKLKSIKKK